MLETSELLETSEMFFGIPSQTFILIICVIIIGWLLSRRVENFTSVNALTEEEYNQEIRNVAAYVGPYIGEIYLYLRAKYYSAPTMQAGPMFKPGGINDPTLADPLLPIARSQVKSWIDSTKMRLKTKFGQDLMDLWKSKWDISYKQAANGVIEVTNVDNGKSATYVL